MRTPFFFFPGLFLAAHVVHAAETSAKETREPLSIHETDAEFVAIAQQPCRHLTALCPDRCDHGGSVAEFKILAYRRHEKTSPYGDDKAEKFRVRVRGREGKPLVAEALLRDIESLKPGDKLRLDWRHEYVTRDGSSFPERPVTTLKPAVSR